jgi:hypothetical protein
LQSEKETRTLLLNAYFVLHLLTRSVLYDHRQLCSDTQKQALLTHIIRRAPHGEQTNVEMAYDILLAPLSQAAPDAVADSEYLSSLDEFAEQCRVFAGQLKESEGNQ